MTGEGRAGEARLAAVLRLLAGAEPTALAQEVGVPVAELAAWRETFIAAGGAALAATAPALAGKSYCGALFDPLDEGFCIIELLYDPGGNPVDYRFLETNPAFERAAGLSGVRGRRIRELVPGIEPHWPESFGRILRTGEAARFQHRAEGLGRWFDVAAAPVGGPGERRLAVLIRDISAHRQADPAQGASDERLHIFIEQAPAALAMFDRDMRYLAASRRWRSDLGLEGQDLRGRSHYEVVPEIPERWREVHRRGLAGEVLRADDDPFHRGDGSVQWLRWEVRPWRDASGAVGGIVIFSEDVSERRLAQDRVRRGEEALHALIRALPVGIAVATADGRLLSFNPAGLAMHGFASLDEMLVSLGEYSAEFELRYPDGRPIPPRDWPLARAMRGEYVADFEVRLRRRDGPERFVVYDVLPIAGPAPDERLVVFVIQDLTERDRTRQALERSLAQSRAIVRQMTEGLVIFDPAGNLVDMNPAALAIHGLTSLQGLPRQVGLLEQTFEVLTLDGVRLPPRRLADQPRPAG